MYLQGYHMSKTTSSLNYKFDNEAWQVVLSF